MTVQAAPAAVQLGVDQAPAGGIEELKQWITDVLVRMVELQASPMVQQVQFARMEAATDAALKRPGEGMLIHAGPDVVGAGKPAGFYVYLGGTWKQMTLT